MASTGDIYAGLWYPICFALMTFVIGLLFVPETHKRDIFSDEGSAERCPQGPNRGNPPARRGFLFWLEVSVVLDDGASSQRQALLFW